MSSINERERVSKHTDTQGLGQRKTENKNYKTETKGKAKKFKIPLFREDLMIYGCLMESYEGEEGTEMRYLWIII